MSEFKKCAERGVVKVNTLILGNSNYGEQKKKLGIKNKETFEKFLIKLEENDMERINGGLVNTNSSSKIAETLRCFNVVFDDDYNDLLIIKDLSSINEAVFSNKKSNLETLLWIAKEMTEELADKIDENICYGGFIDDEFLCNVRDFFLNMYIKIDNYELLMNRSDNE